MMIFDATLMMQQTETLELLASVEHFDAKIERQNRKIRPCSVHINILKNGLNAVFKPFLMAGAEGLEPSARGFGATVETQKS